MISTKSDIRLLLFDGNAILHRAYHAYPPTLVTKDGELTNATYGFTSILLHTFAKFKPSHVVVTFDRKEKTFRHKQFKAYKASRPKMDEELVSQIERTKQVVDTLNIPRFEKAGFEADDLLGTISAQAEKEGIDDIYIITGDRDILQLLSDKTKVYLPARGRSRPEKIYTPIEFKNEYGFEPPRLVDFKALAGDSSDEIPGVTGIGPKTATDLIKNYKNLDGIYQNLNQVKSSVSEKLKRDKAQAYLSFQLAQILRTVELDFKLAKAQLCDYDKNQAMDLFEKLQFFSLIKKLPKDSWEEIFINNHTGVEKQKTDENQMSLF